MKTRSFIAVNLPQEIKQELGNWVENLKKDIKTGVKWVKPEIFHLTLQFLGSLSEEQVAQVKNILQNSIFKANVFLKIKQTGCSPHQNRPRVLFFKCEENKDNTLINLQKIISQALKNTGLQIDERAWQIHLTFGRVKMPIKLPDSFNKQLPILEFKIESIDLMKSELRPEGPEYTILQKYTLV